LASRWQSALAYFFIIAIYDFDFRCFERWNYHYLIDYLSQVSHYVIRASGQMLMYTAHHTVSDRPGHALSRTRIRRRDTTVSPDKFHSQTTIQMLPRCYQCRNFTKPRRSPIASSASADIYTHKSGNKGRFIFIFLMIDYLYLFFVWLGWYIYFTDTICIG
jgi:hypothetical protein